MSRPKGAQVPAENGAVSVIMPILNEERHLREAVAVVFDQDYPGEIELVLALGPSTDRTDEVALALGGAGPAHHLRAQPERPHTGCPQRRSRGEPP